MKVLELFSGTRSIGKAFEARGHEVFSIDFDRRFLANAHCDIETLTTEQILEWFGKPDVIWASPDCATFSMAAISHHREKDPATGAIACIYSGSVIYYCQREAEGATHVRKQVDM